jgi:hypothetical protein
VARVGVFLTDGVFTGTALDDVLFAVGNIADGTRVLIVDTECLITG